MSLLSDLERERIPRSDELAVAVGKKIAASYKLVLLGILWLFTVADVLGLILMVGTIGLMRVLGTHKGDMIEQILGLVAFGVSQILAWTWFARRVGRMRSTAIAVGREGVLLDATISSVGFYRNQTRLWRWHVIVDGKPYNDWSSYIGVPADGLSRGTVKVLALPGIPYGLMFSTPEGHVTRLRKDKIKQRLMDEVAA